MARLVRALPALAWGAASMLALGLWLAPARGAHSRFENTFPSPEALGVEVLEALAAGEAGRLESLALTEREFREEVWPEMPAARGIPVRYAWDDLKGKSVRSLRSSMALLKGRELRLLSVEYRKATTQYRTFVVHRRARLHALDLRTGSPVVVDALGSILQHEGRYKLFSYVVDR